MKHVLVVVMGLISPFVPVRTFAQSTLAAPGRVGGARGLSIPRGAAIRPGRAVLRQ